MESVKVESPSLVLSGGGMKAAAFHVGVSLALKQKGFSIGNYDDLNSNNLAFQNYVGSSAGSIIASFYAAGYSVEDVIFAFTQGKHNLDTLQFDSLKPNIELPKLSYKDIFSIKLDTANPTKWIPSLFSKDSMVWGGLEVLLKKSFKVNGLFSSKKIGDYFQDSVFHDERVFFDDLKANLFIISTYLDYAKKAIFCPHRAESGNKYGDTADYKTDIKMKDAICASASLPPMFAPYKIGEEYYFDGEVRDSLSSHVALEQGSDLVIVSYSMHPYEYTEEMGSLNEYGIPLIANQALYQLIQHKISNHRRHRRKLHNLFNELEGDLSKHMPAKSAKEYIEALEAKFFPSRKSKVIYIHPCSSDHEMFFADHFSLNPKILNKIVTIGFRSAMDSLRKFEFK